MSIREFPKKLSQKSKSPGPLSLRERPLAWCPRVRAGGKKEVDPAMRPTVPSPPAPLPEREGSFRDSFYGVSSPHFSPPPLKRAAFCGISCFAETNNATSKEAAQ